MEFERLLEKHIFGLQTVLVNGCYRHGGYQPFTIHDPKRRRIHKATVRDRIVHQAVVNIIEPIFERQFIFDSFSCRVGKGTHAAADRLRKFLRSASNNNTKTVYAIKCDIRRFFDSVDHEILKSLVRRRVKDTRLLAVVDQVIDSFSILAGKGIPLGNLTSQLFANIYLHGLDRFVKFSLRERLYIRYCDDFVIVSSSQDHLVKLIPSIKAFLKNQLGLAIHQDKIILKTWNQGIDFLGYVLLPFTTVLRTKTKRRMLERLTLNNASSYYGLCRHANTHVLQQAMVNKLWLGLAVVYSRPITMLHKSH